MRSSRFFLVMRSLFLFKRIHNIAPVALSLFLLLLCIVLENLNVAITLFSVTIEFLTLHILM